MATELSNYENDYRLRYRTSTAADISGVGIIAQYADYNVVPLPDETEYGLYGDSDLAAGEAADSEAWPLQPAAASFAGMVDFPANDGLGPIEGRYSINFVNGDIANNDAGFSFGPNNPADGDTGDRFFNTTTDRLFVWNGTVWVDVT